MTGFNLILKNTLSVDHGHSHWNKLLCQVHLCHEDGGSGSHLSGVSVATRTISTFHIFACLKLGQDHSLSNSTKIIRWHTSCANMVTLAQFCVELLSTKEMCSPVRNAGHFHVPHLALSEATGNKSVQESKAYLIIIWSGQVYSFIHLKKLSYQKCLIISRSLSLSEKEKLGKVFLLDLSPPPINYCGTYWLEDINSSVP